MLTVIVTITARGLYAVLTVIVTIMTITGRFYVMPTVIETITGRSICSATSYCDNNDNHEEVY